MVNWGRTEHARRWSVGPGAGREGPTALYQIRLLGEQVVSDATGVPRPVPPPALALVGYLVLHAGLPQQRGRIATLFWPDSTDEQALTNLLTALRAAGGSADGLASLTVYIVDIDDYRAHAREIGEVWQRLIGSDYPAMAGIGVARLWDPAALVEIQGYAVS